VSDGGTHGSRFSRIVGWPVAIARKLGRVVPEAVQGYAADRCAQQSAGIAYRVLFSIAPLAIVLVSIFGLVLQNTGVRSDVVNTIVDALPVSPAGRKDVEDAITSIATPVSAVGLVSLLVFAWAASGMMTAIRQGLESAMHVTDSRPMARGKLVDLLLIVGAGALVLVTVGLTLLGNLLRTSSGSVADATSLPASTFAEALLRGAAFVLSIVVVMLLYRFVPARGLRIRAGLAGAIVTALLLQAIALASGWTYDKATKLSVVYGSLAAALVFLYSIYLYASALLFGAEVAAAWARPEGGPGAPILTQIKELLLGLFVRRDAPPPKETTPDAPPPVQGAGAGRMTQSG
jgi:membrane protein